MGIHKLKQSLLILCIGCLCCACSSEKAEENEEESAGFFAQIIDKISGLWKDSTEVDEGDIDIWDEYNKTRKALKITQEDVVKNKVIITQTLNELREISAMAGIVRQSASERETRETQSEEISRHLKEIREKVESMESQTDDNVVASLKIIIEEKEREIEALKREIRAKDNTIRQKEGDIRNKQSEIDRMYEELVKRNNELTAKTAALEDANQRQLLLLKEAGRDFETLGDEAPSVRGGRDKNRVGQWQRDCYQKAKYYYQKAKANGLDTSSDLYHINDKIAKCK